MTNIQSLLNPLDESRATLSQLSKTEEPEAQALLQVSPRTEAGHTFRESSVQLPRLGASDLRQEFTPSSHARKKQKVSKDAAIFMRGTIRGECRYPPDEFRDDVLEAHHQQYEIFPMGDIANYPRHIPYNSEKKNFLDKTGRECFEVLHYNFKVPGDEKVHCMMWDYNIGLVRITPLFKCTGYSKTTPAKMLNRNVGLREICHSITGGALVAQGYWMPYDAAKAIAATFCWGIRYALTPVFGRDFPATCFPPDSERFGSMIIDAGITQQCADEANEFRLLENRSTSRAASAMPSPTTPDTPTYPRHIKQLRSKPMKVNTQSSGYSTDASNDDAYSLSSSSPNTAYRNVWTPLNTPRSTVHFDTRLPSPREILAGISTGSRKRPNVTSVSTSNSSSPALSPKSRRRVDTDEDYDGDSSGEPTLEAFVKLRGPRKTSNANLPSDVKAAYLLMSLGLEKVGLVQEQEALGIARTGLALDGRDQKRRYSAPMEKLVESW